MIAEFYFLFSRQGAETPAAGILEFKTGGCPYAGSPQVPVPMVTLRQLPYGAGLPGSWVGSIGINPHRARSLLGDRKLEEPLEISLRAIGFDPRDRMPTTTSSKSIKIIHLFIIYYSWNGGRAEAVLSLIHI